jgi:hypothetical protein
MSETLVQELLQQCSTCRSTKLLQTYFSKNVKGQYMKTCDKCRVRLKENKAKKAEQGKRYRENNKDKIAEAKKKFYEENKEKIAEQVKRYRENNKEKLSEKGKKYREENQDKEALAEYNKNYNIENRERLAEQSKIYREKNKEKLAESKKKFYEENKKQISEQVKRYRENNKDKIAEAKKKFYEENKEKIAEYKTQYYKDKRHYCDHNTIKKICKICDPNGKLKALVSSRIHHALKANKLKKSIEYLGCDIETFRTHLEKTFKEGMSWENMGDWEIDHYCPLEYKQDGVKPSIEEVGRRLHYTNTQAMWQKDNRSKSNLFIG